MEKEIKNVFVNNNNNNEKKISRKKSKNTESKSLKSQSDHNTLLKVNYNEKLYNKYSIFFKSKKFKISDDFDAKNSKRFLDKKDKCMQRIVLSDKIEERNEKSEFNEKEQNKRNRKSGVQKIANYCIVISDYDDLSKDEIKFNYTVKHRSRKLDNLKKNKNLSKYFLNNNNESKSFPKLSEIKTKSD